MPRMSIEDLFTLKIAQTWQEVPHGIQRLRVQNMRSWGHRHCRSHAGKPLKNRKIRKKNLYFFYALFFYPWKLFFEKFQSMQNSIAIMHHKYLFFCLFCRFTEQKSNLPATFANCNSVTKIHWFAIFSNIQEKDHFGAKIANPVSLQLTGSKNTSRKSIRILQPPNPSWNHW